MGWSHSDETRDSELLNSAEPSRAVEVLPPLPQEVRHPWPEGPVALLEEAALKAVLDLRLRLYPFFCISLMKVKALVAQSCPTLCNPVDCSPPGSSLHGILQARTLEWVAVPSSKGSFPTHGIELSL